MRASTNPVSEALKRWYRVHARALPWRNPPGSALPRDPNWPYRVWLSEVMLQQTGVQTVIGYYRDFLGRWEDVDALARASEGDVMAAWAGLGYYSRARNLHKTARIVAARGAFPHTEGELRKLPGLGAYTAAAVAAIAFNKRAVVVDANVERVVARLFAIRAPLPAARKLIRARAEQITPDSDCGDFAQAMMDLGATICTARDPDCARCPLGGECRAARSGDPRAFPVRAKRRPKPQRRGRAFWIESKGKVWLVRRHPKGMLGGMRALPDDGWSAQSNGDGAPPVDGDWQALGAVSHEFTHAKLTLELLALRGGVIAPEGEGEWWPIARIEEAGLPSLFAKAAAIALARDLEDPAAEREPDDRDQPDDQAEIAPGPAR